MQEYQAKHVKHPKVMAIQVTEKMLKNWSFPKKFRDGHLSGDELGERGVYFYLYAYGRPFGTRIRLHVGDYLLTISGEPHCISKKEFNKTYQRKENK